MKNWTPMRVAAATLLLVIAIWAFSFFIVIATRDRLPEPVADLGAVGDIFGASGALFSGLALVGLTLALLLDFRRRAQDLDQDRKERQPYLVPELRAGKSRIAQMERAQGHPNLKIVATLDLQNFTEEPALNVKVSAHLTFDVYETPSDTSVARLPIKSLGHQEISVHWHISGARALALGGALHRNEDVCCHIDVKCESLNGQEWKSSVVYSLRLHDQPSDGPRIQATLGGAGPNLQGEPAGLGGDDTVLLVEEPVAGTWNQDPVG